MSVARPKVLDPSQAPSDGRPARTQNHPSMDKTHWGLLESPNGSGRQPKKKLGGSLRLGDDSETGATPRRQSRPPQGGRRAAKAKPREAPGSRSAESRSSDRMVFRVDDGKRSTSRRGKTVVKTAIRLGEVFRKNFRICLERGKGMGGPKGGAGREKGWEDLRVELRGKKDGRT